MCVAVLSCCWISSACLSSIESLLSDSPRASLCASTASFRTWSPAPCTPLAIHRSICNADVDQTCLYQAINFILLGSSQTTSRPSPASTKLPLVPYFQVCPVSLGQELSSWVYAFAERVPLQIKLIEVVSVKMQHLGNYMFCLGCMIQIPLLLS